MGTVSSEAVWEVIVQRLGGGIWSLGCCGVSTTGLLVAYCILMISVDGIERDIVLRMLDVKYRIKVDLISKILEVLSKGVLW